MDHACTHERSLKETGLRRTGRRHLLLHLFDERRAWTAAELHLRLRGTNLSTIYRNLHELLDKKVISEVRVSGAETRFEPADRGHHAHLLCVKCSRAECVPCPVRLTADHQLEMRGLCAACRP